MPVIGRHSVMLRPDSVRRVTPPTTITPYTSTEHRSNQRPTAGDASTGTSRACAAAASKVAFDEKKRGWIGFPANVTNAREVPSKFDSAFAMLKSRVTDVGQLLSVHSERRLKTVLQIPLGLGKRGFAMKK